MNTHHRHTRARTHARARTHTQIKSAIIWQRTNTNYLEMKNKNEELIVMMMMTTMIKGEEQRWRERCGRLHVELNHVTCTFWNSQRTETADVSTSGAARPALSSAETRQALRVALGVTMATNSRSRIFRWLLVVLRCVRYATSFCPLCTLANCT